MLPDPIHPAVVHIPVALAVLSPALALLALLSIRHGLLPLRAWALVVVAQALLASSAWLGVETGERDEELVERVVAERHIEAHEEAGERFLALSLAAFVVSAVGLLRGRPGVLGRLAALGVSILVLWMGLDVGHSGGELVYRRGAAAAHVERLRGISQAEVDRAPQATTTLDEEEGVR